MFEHDTFDFWDWDPKASEAHFTINGYKPNKNLDASSICHQLPPSLFILSQLHFRESKNLRISKMPFKRYVEIGRVALVNYGNDYGRLVVIVDVLDQNRVLVDAPDMVRGQMNLKRLSLTDIKVEIEKSPNKKTLVEAMETADVKNKWENCSWGRKLIVQKRRAALNDFDRFKIMTAKIKKSGAVKQELAKLKKQLS
ncbi:60S ribosomal protein L14-1 [Spinacia oleracea]|uniref:60S ribosomal protein L14-1 n=1 Tax=Spinacia oleracea TaxID=3562 RepID=A0A9R0I435_SPIOL|nr:60S ribosomal protein L14-1-like [Spinacia oleracea]